MKKFAYILAAVAVMFAASSCLKQNGSLDYDSMPSPSPDHYLMTVSNDSNINTIWLIPEKGDKANPGALPLQKPDDLESSTSCFPLAAKSSKDIWVNDNVSHPTQSYSKEDSVTFYVFKEEVFRNTDWAEILADPSKYTVLRYSVQELVDAGRKVKYK